MHIPKQAAPLIVTDGSDEPSEFQRQSQDFLAAWQGQGLVGRYLPLPGMNHFTAIEGCLDADSFIV